MSDQIQRGEPQGGGVALPAPEAEELVELPPLYRVVLLNDDYTPMDFVVWLLQRLFHHDPQTAEALMWRVHRQGRASVGIYPYDVARTKAELVHRIAEEHGHPLRCTVEPDTSGDGEA